MESVTYWTESLQEQPMPTTPASHDSGAMTAIKQTAGSQVGLPLLLLSIALLASACDVPRFQGPQVQAPPEGFLRKSDVLQDRRMFPDRPTIHFDAWIETEWGEFTGIYINGHAGTTTLEEVVEARAWAMENPPDHPMAYGDIETVSIDGRTGWAWMEMWRENGLHEVRYHAAVPYDTITYTVDFTTGDPKFKIRPDSIRTIVSSFAVGRTEWKWRLLALSTVVGVLVLRAGWSKLQRRYENVRHMTLAKIPVENAAGAVQDDPLQSPAGLPEVDGTE